MASDVPAKSLHRAVPADVPQGKPAKLLQPATTADQGSYGSPAGTYMHVRSMASMGTVASTDSLASVHAEERAPLGMRPLRPGQAGSSMHKMGIAEEGASADIRGSGESAMPGDEMDRSEAEALPGSLWGPGRCCVQMSDTDSDTEADSTDGKAPAYVSRGVNAMTRDIAGGVTEPLLAVSIPSQGILADSITPGAVAVPVTRAAHVEPEQDVVAGMLYYATSSIFFAGMGVSSKLLQDAGYPVWELLFYRSLLICTLTCAALYSTGEMPFGVRKGMLLLRGTVGYTNIAMFFLACFYLPLATATTFTFLSPLIVAMVSPWLLKETPSRAVALVIPVCIGGVVLVTQPPALFGGSAQALSAVGLAIGLSQPFFGAGVNIVVRELRRTETTQVIILSLVACTFVYSCIGCVFSWQHLIAPRSWREAALLLSLGAFGYCNQLCTTIGLQKAEAASVSSMQYFSLVFSQIAGVVVFGEFTTPVQATGMVIIVGSMLGYMWCESRSRGKSMPVED